MATKTKRCRTKRINNKKLVPTPGELLLVWRRRLKWNQTQAAKYYKVSIFNYKLAEYDKLKNFKYEEFKFWPLHDYEKCVIYRKRSGKTQIELGRELGVGRYWIRLQELGSVPCRKLIAYWEG